MKSSNTSKKTESVHPFFKDLPAIGVEYGQKITPLRFLGDVEALTGYKANELTSNKVKWNQVVHPDDWNIVVKDFDLLVKQKQNQTKIKVYRIVTKKGQVKTVNEQIITHPDKDSSDVIAKGFLVEHQNSETAVQEPGWVKVDEDSLIQKEIKKRKRAELKLLEEKGFLLNILDSFTYPFYIIDAETYQISLTNQKAREMYGEKAATCYEYSHHRDTPCDKTCLCPLRTVKKTKEPCFTEHLHFDQDDEPRFFEVHGFPIFDQKGEVNKVIEYTFDITERRKAELALRESEERYRLLFENEHNAIMMFDAESFDIIDTNQAATTMYQFSKEEFLSMKAPDVSNEQQETISAIKNAEIGDKRLIPQRWHKKKDGTVFPVEISAGAFHLRGRTTICAIIRDITRRVESEEQNKRMEKRLFATQKMNAIGTLAGGIAHDFNNILFAQIGYLEMVVSELEKGHKCFNYIQESLDASNRAAELVKQILTFSRSDHVSVEPINVAPILKETVKMLISSFPSNIRIKSDIDVNCHNVIGNPVQIQQIILNIAANAEYAMKDSIGELFFELKEKTLTNEKAKKHGFDSGGSYVSFVISDTGPGIDDELKEHIFEPYFTTKPSSQGSGMGLAVVHGIVVNNMEGSIYVESEPGQGTKITMLFPALIEGKQQPKSVFIAEKKARLSEQIVILFVDDDEMQCSMGETILGNLGYHVICQTNPDLAISIFKKEMDYIDLVITDQTMPGMTGIQMAREMKENKPEIQFVLMATDSLKLTDQKLKQIGVSKVISKPVSKHTLAESIKQVLGKSPKIKS